MSKCKYIIVVAGLSGSGKSTMVNALGKHYGNKAYAIDIDDIDDKASLEALESTKDVLGYGTIDMYHYKRMYENMRQLSDIIKKCDREILIFTGVISIIREIASIVGNAKYIPIYLDVPLQTIWERRMKREMDTILRNIKDIVNEPLSNPHAFHIRLLHHYKIRTGFCNNPLWLQDEYYKNRDELTQRGYTLVTEDDMINYLNEIIKTK